MVHIVYTYNDAVVAKKQKKGQQYMIKTIARNGLIATIVAVTLLLSAYVLLATNRPAAAGSTDCTWIGAGVDDNWSTAANWSCESGTIPADGAMLTFPYENATVQADTTNNDLSSSFTYTGITFSGECNAISQYSYAQYRFTGNNIQMAGDIIANMPTHTDAESYHCRPEFGMDLVMVADGQLDRVRIEGELVMGLYDVMISDTNLWGAMTGTGTLLTVGDVTFDSDSPGYGGTTTVTGGRALFFNGGAFGSADASLVIGSGGQIVYVTPQPATIPVDVTVQAGAGSPAIFGQSQSGDSSPGEYYAKNCSPANGCSSATVLTATFTGTLTLQQNMDVYVVNGQLSFTGPIVGNGYGIIYDDTNSANDGSYGNLVINSSANDSTSPNGTRTPTRYTTTIVTSTTDAIYVGIMNRVNVNGQRGDVMLRNGGILGGSGVVGAISGNGTVAPGNSPDTLDSGSLNLDAPSGFEVEIGGTNSGEYDQLNVTGTVDLGGAVLSVVHWDDFIPVEGSTAVMTIINNDGSDAITSTFDQLAEGATIVVDGVTYTISYVGGTGNDVTLTVFDSPGPPDTSGVFPNPGSIGLAAGIVAVGVGLLVLRKFFFKTRTARK